jgi:hypothetical protein
MEAEKTGCDNGCDSGCSFSDTKSDDCFSNGLVDMMVVGTVADPEATD